MLGGFYDLCCGFIVCTVRLLAFLTMATDMLTNFRSIVFPLIDWPIHDPFDDVFQQFHNSFRISPFSSNYPTEYLKSVLPILCHSHNDYWRQRPLFSALGTGCIGVEADIWPVSGELYVGHSENQLTEDRTLRNLYIDPLVEVLERMNPQTGSENALKPKGAFYQDPAQTLVLLIDFKTSDPWDQVIEQLDPLRVRGYLTYWNGIDRVEGPVTVVASGAAPFDRLISNTTYRDIFYDAPLTDLGSTDVSAAVDYLDGEPTLATNRYKYNPRNSYYASASITRAIGLLSGLALTQPQTELIRTQIKQAKQIGLVPRYWGTPRWPRALRNEMWSVLMKERVGVLNVDDLRAARKGMWGNWR
jgi:hypothetical protein